MLNNKKIGMIGTGNMGNALIDGLIRSGAAKAENIICSDASERQLAADKGKIQGGHHHGQYRGGQNSGYHSSMPSSPRSWPAYSRKPPTHLDMSKLIISIAAGVPLAAIESLLKKDLRLIRVMPNVAVAVREGATAVAAGGHADKEDVKLAMAIFDSVGKSIFLKENYLMDAITGLSGSGPAYIFMIVDALADAGVKVGLSRKDALFLASQTILGSAKLLLETGAHPGQLKDSVTSPGGTAIAGLHTLEKGGLRTTLINAVEAATNRSKELGRP
jgi:pyrroline-5-carboxylate reductase